MGLFAINEKETAIKNIYFLSKQYNRWLWRRDAKPGATWVFPNLLSCVAGPVYLLLLPRMCRETNGVTLVGADAESGCRHLFLLSGIFTWWSDWLASTYYVTVSPCFYCVEWCGFKEYIPFWRSSNRLAGICFCLLCFPCIYTFCSLTLSPCNIH